jgi:hypothetical protein
VGLVRRLAPGAILTLSAEPDRQTDRIVLEIQVLRMDAQTGALSMRGLPEEEVRALDLAVQMALEKDESSMRVNGEADPAAKLARAPVPPLNDPACPTATPKPRHG